MRKAAAAAAAAVACLLVANRAAAQVPSPSSATSLGNSSGSIGPANPLATLDSNNAAFRDAKALTPSGTAGQPGTIAGAAAGPANTGYSFGWVCTTPGLGSITTVTGAVLPYYFAANNGGINRDGYQIEDAEPGSGGTAAAGCSFWVLR